MTARISARRRGAFLRALGRTGNYAVASEQAGVSRNWVLKARGEEAGFDAACLEAVAAVRARLAAAGGKGAGAGLRSSWGHLDGVALVVRGTGGSGARRVQIGRARSHRWGPLTEEKFLAVLAATCNVKAAYEAVGMTKGSAYTHRRRWPEFARRWAEAVEEAGVRLEFALAVAARNPFAAGVRHALPEEAAPPTPEEMFRGLHMHKRELGGGGGRPGRAARLPEAAAVRERISRACEVMERARAIPEERLARDREAFARRGRGG